MSGKRVLTVILLLAFCAEAPQSADVKAKPSSEKLLHALREQGTSAGRILGVDEKGIPQLCGTVDATRVGKPPSRENVILGPDDLPAGLRSWTTIPSVIRDDGVDSFLLEVDANGPANGIILTDVNTFGVVAGPTAANSFELHDDGLDGDRAAGDFVFTAGPFRRRPSYPMPTYYQDDPESPMGVDANDFGRIVIEETDGTTTGFTEEPMVGLLASDIPATTTVQLSPTVVISPHLINIKTDTRTTQRALHSAIGENWLPSIYSVLPDRIHQVVYLSTDRVEVVNGANNGVIGSHSTIRVDYTGEGREPFDNSAESGSQGVLMGITWLDIHNRGVRSRNLIHELGHTWAAHLSTSLGLGDGSHWSGLNNFPSTLGGTTWTPNPDGSYTIDCAAVYDAQHVYAAPEIERYLAGFLDGSGVPPLMGYSENSAPPFLKCLNENGRIDGSEIVTIHPIADVQAIHGVRTPGPATSQKNFVLGFVAESHNRLLNPTEMTYFDILADHFTKTVPVGVPDPRHAFGWASMARYWGPGVTWRSKLYTDADQDGVLDDGDSSGVDFDNPCAGGTSQNCDDNCPGVVNASQADTNADGVGDACSPVPGAPGAPANLSATGGPLRVDVAWTAPLSQGGGPITFTRILRRFSLAEPFSLIGYAFGTETTYTDTLVNAGQVYFYSVAAQNEYGVGPASNEASATPMPATVPTAPQSLSETTGNSRVDLYWTAPASDGGSALTGYRVYRSPDNVNFTLLGSGDCANLGVVLTCGDTTAANGAKYYYRVNAVNMVGQGPASNVVTLTPSAPASLNAQHNAGPNSGKIKLTWTVPVNSGGLPVTNYRVYQSANNITFSLVTSGGCENLTTATTCTRTGLTTGVQYYFKVKAVNAVGEGPASVTANAPG